MTPISSLAAQIDFVEEPQQTLNAEGLLRRWAASHPEAPALSDRQGPGADGGRSFSAAQLDTSVDALAGVFVGLGLSPGDRIAVQLPNSVLSPLVTLAAWRAGLTVCVLPLPWRRFEIARAAAELQPRALIGGGVFDGVSVAHGLCEAAASELSVRFVLGFGPDLPDGVAPLDQLLDLPRGRVRPAEGRALSGPALISFTARAGAPLVPVFHTEEELLAQGALAMNALGLDRRDTILNPFPFSSMAGVSFALMPWLISGGTLLQHQPFDFATFAAQLIEDGATVTALPASLLAPCGSGVLLDPRCRLRLLGAVWSPATLRGNEPASHGLGIPLFDLFPLGDKGGFSQPLARDGRRARPKIERDPELLQHGAFAIAATELDQLYRSFPGFLDAACFALPCPILGDRILAAGVAKPAQSISLEALRAFLSRQGVAPYKYPERLLVLKSIPRDSQGRVLRDELRRQVQ